MGRVTAMPSIRIIYEDNDTESDPVVMPLGTPIPAIGDTVLGLPLGRKVIARHIDYEDNGDITIHVQAPQIARSPAPAERPQYGGVSTLPTEQRGGDKVWTGATRFVRCAALSGWRASPGTEQGGASSRRQSGRRPARARTCSPTA